MLNSIYVEVEGLHDDEPHLVVERAVAAAIAEGRLEGTQLVEPWDVPEWHGHRQVWGVVLQKIPESEARLLDGNR